MPFGRFGGVLLTRDTNPLEPGSFEYKLYAQGSGPCSRSASPAGPASREELVRYHKG